MILVQEKAKVLFKLAMGEISCHYLPPGGSIVPRYVLQLLFSEKSQK
jgi:hypothetical protein